MSKLFDNVENKRMKLATSGIENLEFRSISTMCAHYAFQ